MVANELNEEFEKVIKLNSLEELADYGLVAINVDKKRLVESNLRRFLEDDGLNLDMLALLMNQTKQNVSLMLNSPSSISLISALKLSKILDRPVEQIFSLTDDNWYQSFPFDKKETRYINVLTFEIVNNEKRLEELEKNGNKEYCELATGELLTKREFDSVYRRFVVNSRRSISDEERKSRANEFYEKYCPLYMLIGKKVEF